jgi:hypothetical protein
MVEGIRGYGLAGRIGGRGGTGRAGFRLGDDAPAPVAAAAAVGAVAGLHALQGEVSAAERDAAAARRGTALLGELDTLQRGLLDGRVADSALRRLAALTEGEVGADPGLRETVEALTLRARVELARLGR